MFWEPFGDNYALNTRMYRKNPRLYKVAVGLRLGFWGGLCCLLIYCGHLMDRVGQTMIESEHVKAQHCP